MPACMRPRIFCALDSGDFLRPSGEKRSPPRLHLDPIGRDSKCSSNASIAFHSGNGRANFAEWIWVCLEVQGREALTLSMLRSGGHAMRLYRIAHGE